MGIAKTMSGASMQLEFDAEPTLLVQDDGNLQLLVTEIKAGTAGRSTFVMHQLQ